MIICRALFILISSTGSTSRKLSLSRPSQQRPGLLLGDLPQDYLLGGVPPHRLLLDGMPWHRLLPHKLPERRQAEVRAGKAEMRRPAGGAASPQAAVAARATRRSARAHHARAHHWAKSRAREAELLCDSPEEELSLKPLEPAPGASAAGLVGSVRSAA